MPVWRTTASTNSLLRLSLVKSMPGSIMRFKREAHRVSAKPDSRPNLMWTRVPLRPAKRPPHAQQKHLRRKSPGTITWLGIVLLGSSNAAGRGGGTGW